MAQKQIGIQVEQAVETLYILWTRNREQSEVKAAQLPRGSTPGCQPQTLPPPTNSAN